jgi:hypothetical protein
LFHLKKVSPSQCGCWIIVSERGQIRLFENLKTFSPTNGRSLPAWRPVQEWGWDQFAYVPTSAPSTPNNLVFAEYRILPFRDAGWGSQPVRSFISDEVANAVVSVNQSWASFPLWLPSVVSLALFAVAVVLFMAKPEFAHRKRGFLPVMSQVVQKPTPPPPPPASSVTRRRRPGARSYS